MLERISALRKTAGDNIADYLEDTYNNLLEIQARAKNGKAADIKEYSAAASAFEETITKFEKTYAGSDFANTAVVYSYLISEGYSLSRRTLYDHKGKGYLKSCQQGGYSKKDVDAYAAKYLTKNINSKSLNLADRRSEADIRLKELRAEKERLLIDEARGRLIDRDKVGREFAGRIEEIKRGFSEIENALPYLLAGKQEQEIREILKDRFSFMLEQYSRKLESVINER